MVAPRLSHEWIQSGAVILTCHWHHARFDLRSGPTFDLWADDVPLRAVRIVDGEVWVAPAPAVRNEAAPVAPPPPRRACPHISLVIGKAVLGSTAAGVPSTMPFIRDSE